MADTKLKKSDDSLILLLACGATVEQAAKQVGMSERTVYRRLADPGFKQKLQQARIDMMQRTSGTLTASGAEAVKTLLALLRPETPATVRLGAARAVLELGMKVREFSELDRRLAEIETQFDAMEKSEALSES